jgi:hypothetical protein
MPAPPPALHRVQPHNRSMIPGSTGPPPSRNWCQTDNGLPSSSTTLVTRDGNTPPLAHDGAETSSCGRIGPVPIKHKSPEVVRRETSFLVVSLPPFTRRGRSLPSADRVAFPTWGHRHRHCHRHFSFLLFSVITSQKLPAVLSDINAVSHPHLALLSVCLFCHSPKRHLSKETPTNRSFWLCLLITFIIAGSTHVARQVALFCGVPIQIYILSIFLAQHTLSRAEFGREI